MKGPLGGSWGQPHPSIDDEDTGVPAGVGSKCYHDPLRPYPRGARPAMRGVQLQLEKRQRCSPTVTPIRRPAEDRSETNGGV